MVASSAQMRNGWVVLLYAGVTLDRVSSPPMWLNLFSTTQNGSLLSVASSTQTRTS